MRTLRIEHFETLADIEDQINRAYMIIPTRLEEIRMTRADFERLRGMIDDIQPSQKALIPVSVALKNGFSGIPIVIVED
jgi:hypothetical protein